MPWIIMLLLCSGGLALAGSVPANRLQSVVYYLVHAGGPLSLEVQADYPESKRGSDTAVRVVPAVLATVYDPDERPTDLFWRDEAGKRQGTLRLARESAAVGVWQVRVTVSVPGVIRHQLRCQPELPVALMPARSWIRHRDTALIDGKYFLVPADVSGELSVEASNCQVTLLDEAGRTAAECGAGTNRLQLRPGEVYQLRLTSRSPDWHWIAFGGFPTIFAPTAEMARSLAGGRVAVPGEAPVAHRFQAGIAVWKKALKPTELVLPPVNLQAAAAAMAAEPESHFLLSVHGALAGAEFLLQAQNLDSASADFGSSPHDPGVLAFLYVLDKPYNPYYRLAPLRQRLVLYYLNKLARQRPIGENGTEEEIGSNYAGGDGMRMVPDSIAFMLLAPDLSAAERQLWGDGLALPLRRFFSDRVSCENQSAHWPVKLFAYARGSGQPLFAELAAHFIADAANPVLNPYIRSGYLQEAYGPDATYQGLGTSLIAFYYHFSRDPQAAGLLRRIYSLMNHTVAPEPDGRILYGPSGFSHRTMGGWPKHQYGAGTRLLAAELPEAACWHQSPRSSAPDDLRGLLASLARHEWLPTWRERPYVLSSYAFAPYARIWHTFPPLPVLPDARLPVLQDDAFSRNFNDEFHFFRHPGYYLGVYTGRTAGKHVFWNRHRAPYSCVWTEADGVFSSNERKIFMPLSGPQLFWTPDFGVALLSMNWNLHTLWTSRWEKGEELDWGSYWETSHEYLEDRQGVTLVQRFRQQAITLRRELRCQPQGVSVFLGVAGELAGGRLVEQLPYPRKPGVVLQSRRQGETLWREGVPGHLGDSLRWLHPASGAGVQVTFDRPVRLRAGRAYADQEVTMALIEAEVPDSGLSYRLEGFRLPVPEMQSSGQTVQ